MLSLSHTAILSDFVNILLFCIVPGLRNRLVVHRQRIISDITWIWIPEEMPLMEEINGVEIRKTSRQQITEINLELPTSMYCPIMLYVYVEFNLSERYEITNEICLYQHLAEIYNLKTYLTNRLFPTSFLKQTHLVLITVLFAVSGQIHVTWFSKHCPKQQKRSILPNLWKLRYIMKATPAVGAVS